MSRPIINNLRRLALLSFGAFLIVMLGANSVAAAGGPLTWLTFWQLPSAGGDLAGVGPVILLPVISVVAWALYLWLTPAGDRPPWNWGSGRITLPALALWLWAIGHGAWQCLDGPCPRGTIVRLIILAAVFFWVYLLIANEKPDLLWVVAPVLLLQSTVAIAQFVIQRDLGLQWLGELELDPAVSGVIVVMNEGQRWLRSYGLTNQPNVLVRLLVLGLLMLPIVARGARGFRKAVVVLSFGMGVAALTTTFSRWGWVCLALGIGINAIPYVNANARTRTITGARASRNTALLGGVIVVAGLLFLAQYGGAVYGRFFDLDNPLEAGSLLVRQRDMAAGIQIWQSAFLSGVGPANYEAAAAAILPAAALVPTVPLVPSVPLFVASELGLIGLLLWVWWGVWPLWRRSALAVYAPYSALWAAAFALGLFGTSPYPLYDLRSAMLIAMSAGLIAQSYLPPARTGEASPIRPSVQSGGIGDS